MSNELAATPSPNVIPAMPLPVNEFAHDRLAGVMKKVTQLSAIAAHLFPGPVAVEVEADPEIEGRRYVVFSVETREPIKEVVNRRLEWFRLTSALLENDEDLVHLFVIFRQ